MIPYSFFLIFSQTHVPSILTFKSILLSTNEWVCHRFRIICATTPQYPIYNRIKSAYENFRLVTTFLIFCVWTHRLSVPSSFLSPLHIAPSSFQTAAGTVKCPIRWRFPEVHCGGQTPASSSSKTIFCSKRQTALPSNIFSQFYPLQWESFVLKSKIVLPKIPDMFCRLVMFVETFAPLCISALAYFRHR